MENGDEAERPNVTRRRPWRRAVGWLSVAYEPSPREDSFFERAKTQRQNGLEVTVAALSDRESRRFFGIRMAHKGMQPLWIRIVNRTAKPFRLDLFAIDANYFTPLEAAYINHFSMGKRLLSFGLLAWMFLILLPLLPFKLFGARSANRRMDAYFKEHAYHPGPIHPSSAERSGFLFTTLDEGTKVVEVRLLAHDEVVSFSFSLDVPGLILRADEAADAPPTEPIDRGRLRSWLQEQPRATTNRRGTKEGDPLNLVVIGDRANIAQCFGARWDEAESITLSTCWKTDRAFFFGSGYRYSPVSPLYHEGRSQDLALQKARASINERMHLRLWRTRWSLEGQRVWIGQISRDIGVRFTARTWNLSTHRIDPDVDEARDYLVDYLMSADRVSQIGYVTGVGVAEPSDPRRNLTGDPYYTDGQRVVVVLSPVGGGTSFLSWH